MSILLEEILWALLLLGSVQSIGCATRGPVGSVWYGRGPSASPPSSPLVAPASVTAQLYPDESSCFAVLAAARKFGFHKKVARPCLPTRDHRTPLYLELQRRTDAGFRYELTYSWKEKHLEGGAYIAGYQRHRREALDRVERVSEKWHEILKDAAEIARTLREKTSRPDRVTM